MNEQNEQTSSITEVIKDIFEKINTATSISDLKAIEEYDSLSKYKMDTKNYPRIVFEITEKEINSLFIGDDLDDLTFKPNSPLEKLLYAVIWKNGDLKKIKHIVHGIKNHTNDDDEKETGIVFNQFGKYLVDRKSQPIIDQHVLRSFNYWNHIGNPEKAEKITTINKTHLKLINDYKNWIKGLIENNDLNKIDNSEFLYLVDRILFALGKKIKNELNK